MKQTYRILTGFTLLALLVVALGVSTQPAKAAGPYVCLPSCDVTDGRMLSVASVGYQTLAGLTISFKIAVPGTIPSFDLGFFDGDTGGLWDIGTTQLVYTLYADPTASGDTSIQLAQWTGLDMTDNAWKDFTVTQDPQAQAPSGAYFYHLHVTLPNALSVQTWSNFKIRSDVPVELSTNESFAYSVPVFTPADANIIYPSGIPTSIPNNVTTTFDGTWDLYISVPSSTSSFTIWDGDMDYGSYNCTVNDTNDPDTPAGIPAFALGTSTVAQGVAVSSIPCSDLAGNPITGPQGQTNTTGNPTDDSRFPAFQRPGPVTYDVTDSNGNVYHNGNPSGNLEWEQFKIDPNATSRAAADYYQGGTWNGNGQTGDGIPGNSGYVTNGSQVLMPAGIYHVHISGLDIRNLNAWHLVSGEALCVLADGTPCVPVLHPYLIGDTVWYDANGNGVQDNGETGIPGVNVTLLDSNDQPVPGGTTTTDANGQYQFSVEAGTYSVQIDASNFNAGGALAGDASTTGGEKQTNTVSTADVMTYDFGYQQLASLGDFVWNDLNGNGIQDSGEPGLPGVTVNLLGSDGSTVVASTTTVTDGSYSFPNLTPGTYQVQFVLPVGDQYTQYLQGGDTTKDSNANPGASGLSGPITLTPGQNDTNWDAGLVLPASIGDFVWNDLNGNGIQDSGEPGLPGVTVNLLDAAGANVLATATTDANGGYSFPNLAPGTYQVQFVLPSGDQYTQYLQGGNPAVDSNANPGAFGFSGPITLNSGQTDTSWDAGLVPSASLGDFVWNDANGNGIQDGGETGISGVTVKLLGSDGTTVVSTTTTDSSGKYSFSVAPGTYYVQFVAPSGYVYTQYLQGTNTALDSNANPASSGKSTAITVVAGQSDTSWDAGLVAASCTTGSGTWNFNTVLGLLGTSQTYTVNGLTITAYGYTSPSTPTALYGKNDGGDEHGLGLASDTVNHEIDTNHYIQLDLGELQAAGVLNAQIEIGSMQTGEPAAVYGSNTQGSLGTLVSTVPTTADNTFFSIPGFPAYRYYSVKANAATPANVTLEAVSFNCTPVTSTIGDFVWKDTNGNGIQDSGEPGLQGVSVQLLGSDGTTVLASTTTATNGSYSFTNLAAGTYYVQFSAPSGYAFTLKNVSGSTTANDSNVNASTGKTDAITLAAGATDNTIDAGLQQPFVCTGNLVLNPSFELNTGSPPTNWTNGTAGSINVPAVDGKNVGYISGTGIMYQKVNVASGNSYTLTFFSGSHVPSIQTVKIQYFTSGNTAIGSASVHTITSDLEVSGFGGPYTLTLAAAPSNAKYLKIMVSANNKDYAKVDALCLQATTSPATVATAAIGDFVWNDLNGNGIQDTGEPGLSGVTVNLLGSDGTTVVATTTTDANGNYSFNNLAAGTYYVQFAAPSGFTFTGKNAAGSTTANDSNAIVSTGVTDAITLAASATDNSIDAGLIKPFVCTGNLVLNPSFELNTGSPPTNWTNGTAGSINVPAVDGKNVGYISGTGIMYQKVNVASGNSYTLTFFSGSHVPSIQTVKIQYFTSGNTAIGSASVHTITSDLEVSGFGGPYTLTLAAAPSNAKYLEIMVSANNKDYAKVDALCLQATTSPATVATAAIGDFVWNDLNGNGIQDSGEPGLQGVTVQLLGSDGSTVLGSTTTDANGNYSFNNLAAGTYYVQFAAPSGFTFTGKNAAGSTTANDSNVIVSTGVTDAITLAAGATDNTIDAGLNSVSTVNLCSPIRTPGFWKNYSNHMTDATFLNLLNNTQDFNGLSVNNAVTILSTNNGNSTVTGYKGVDAKYLKFLLTSEINAVWNGNDSAAALGGVLGTGTYQGTGMTVNQLLHQAYLDRNKFSSTESDQVVYLGSGGEGVSASACLVQP